MSKKTFGVCILVSLLLVSAFLFWRIRDSGASGAIVESEILQGLTADQINLILKSEQGALERAGGTVESRRLFLNGMREYLSLAAQARREGMADDPIFAANFAYKKRMLLADLYSAKLTEEQGKQYVVPQEKLEAVWAATGNEKLFSKDIEALRTIQLDVAKQREQDETTVPRLSGDSLAKARTNWARAKVLAELASADPEFMARPELPLRVKVLEAGILSADYLRKHWAGRVRATASEKNAYLAAHPEFDLGKKVEKAREILSRAKAGEDFADLVRSFSEDRTTNTTGGLYENKEQGEIWIEVENAALALENGGIAPALVESNTGFHIVKLEKKERVKNSDGIESFRLTVRHILFQKSFPDPSHNVPSIPAPFLTPVEIATAEVEKEKRKRFVEEIIRLNKIEIPDDFSPV